MPVAAKQRQLRHRKGPYTWVLATTAVWWLLAAAVSVPLGRSSLFVAEGFAPAPGGAGRGSSFLPIRSGRDPRLFSQGESENENATKTENDPPSALSKELLETAAELRRDVAAYEASKREASEAAASEKAAREAAAEEERLRMSAVLPILKGDGTEVMERCFFSRRIASSGSGSRIVVATAPLPLGIVLGQEESSPRAGGFCPITVDGVAGGSHGESAGVEVGDLLRACTACSVTMEQPTWQLLAGGIGRPVTTRRMVPTDNLPLEEALECLASNAADDRNEVWLVLERGPGGGGGETETESETEGGRDDGSDEPQ